MDTNDLQLAHLGDLIATLPNLLGFHPAHSIIALALNHDDTLRSVLRTDLPPDNTIDTITDSLTWTLCAQNATTIVLLIVDESSEPNETTHRYLIEQCERSLVHAGIRVSYSLWATGTTPGHHWACYTEPDCAGTVPAVQPTKTGATPHPDRDALVATLSLADDDILERRRDTLDRAMNAPITTDHPAN